MTDRTIEQRNAIGAGGPLVLVAAGAGSGKTAVLVDRYLRHLQTRDVEELVAVTFTEAAAAEMRDRIRKEVERDPNLARHRKAIDQAKVGTLHSLCLTILREHPVEAGVEPGFDVLSEDVVQFELATIALDAIESAATDAERALPVLEIGDFYLRQSLAEMVADRDRVAQAFRSMGPTREAWSEHAARIIEEAARRAIDVHGPALFALLDELEQLTPLNPADTFAGGLEDVQRRVHGWRDATPGRLLSAIWAEEAGESVFEQVSMVGSGASWPAGEFVQAKDVLKQLRVAAKAILKMALPPTSAEELALDVLWETRILFEDACERYEQRKQELGGLDFLDLELATLRLLSGHPAVADSYRRGWAEILVDEFQDTNALQNQIIDLLSLPATNGDRPALFLVGDAKQSIYRFRGGDVKQFRRREKSHDRPPLPLSQSFRTHESLVGCTNQLFDQVFAGALEDFEAPMQAMTGRPGESPASPHLSLLLVPKESAGGGKLDASEAGRYEASLVAADISRRISEGQLIWDRELERYRACRFGDFALLLRRFSKVQAFEQALEAEGLPYSTVSGAGFFMRQEVRDLANLARWLAEPADEIALAGILRSPMFALDDETLARLRLGNRRPLMGLLASPPDPVAPAMRERAVFASELLTDLRSRAARQPLDDVLCHAIEETGFEAAWASVSGGEQSVANIRKFVDLARSLSGRSLDEFVDYVTERREEFAREAQAVTDTADAVQVMTVHGAKGLEFPIVYIPEAHTTVRGGAEPPVVWRAEDGIGTKLQREVGASAWRKTALATVLGYREDEEEAAEYRRVFYVAATRGADYVVVSGAADASTESWMGRVSDCFLGAPLPAVEVRFCDAFDPEAPRPNAANLAQIPAAEDEHEVVAPLVERPRVIPVRSSTPVTALREGEVEFAFVGHSDGLGALRGTLAHRAIELRYGLDREPDLEALAAELARSAPPAATLRDLVTEVQGFLDMFDGSELVTAIRESRGRYFELPFAFDWDGVPVHGVIDLAFEDARGWHVIDFKSDKVRNARESTKPYLPQLALYALALERATGSPPDAGLYFLRTGELYRPGAGALAAALASTRLKVDAGAVLEPVLDLELSEEDA